MFVQFRICVHNKSLLGKSYSQASFIISLVYLSTPSSYISMSRHIITEGGGWFFSKMSFHKVVLLACSDA